MATPNSSLRFRGIALKRKACAAILCCLLVSIVGFCGPMEDAETQLKTARKAWERAGASTTDGWKFARACFDRAEFASTKTERSGLAEMGISAAQEVLRRESNNAPGHFYLALNLGQLARTRALSALGLVSDMEKHFLRAIALQPGFDHAGPERSLGMLYRDAPGWPASIGSRTKARKHLERAVELDAAFPENILTLIETEAGWEEFKKAQARMPTLEARLKAAEAELRGPAWAATWQDWKQRVEIARKRLAQPLPEAKPVGKAH
ncbi:MAG: hypothetical protein HYR88_04370 [Verrucomicrobia bacterium]|nr:hypothetical protein [Verrucomicrobiota bacterium]MBI3868230.1 hypothetical protein [Verrucomicrobiota bacterium]